jgi:hypothetical protein
MGDGRGASLAIQLFMLCVGDAGLLRLFWQGRGRGFVII